MGRERALHNQTTANNHLNGFLIFLPGANFTELVAGWSSTLDGLCVRSAGDVCRVWAVIHRPEEAQCKVDCEDPPQVMKLFSLCLL